MSFFRRFIIMTLLTVFTASLNAGADALRRSPVSYHMSFDDSDFFKEDFIEQSGKKSVEDRNLHRKN